MKRNAAFLILLLSVVVSAQKVEAPQSYKLSPAASKAITQIESQRAESIRRINEQADRDEGLILLGANVPEDARPCAQDKDGIFTCQKKAEAAKVTK